MSALLAFAGRNGPLLLFFGVATGLVFPDLAGAAKPWMGMSVFVFTLGSFLKVDAASMRAELRRPRRALVVLCWTLFGVPVLAWSLCKGLAVPAPLTLAIVLCMLAPPVGSAAAMAAMLDLNAALALVATVAISLLAPAYMPPLAALVGGSVAHIDAAAMLLRILAVVGGAASIAFILRRCAGSFIAHNPSVMTGVSVVGLLTVAIGAMEGMREHVFGDGWQAARLMALAVAVNAGFQFVGALLFRRLGAVDALTVGLLSGIRNVTLVWVAVAPWLVELPLVEAYLAASVFPIFMLPLLTRAPIAFLKHRAQSRSLPARQPAMTPSAERRAPRPRPIRGRRSADGRSSSSPSRSMSLSMDKPLRVASSHLSRDHAVAARSRSSAVYRFRCWRFGLRRPHQIIRWAAGQLPYPSCDLQSSRSADPSPHQPRWPLSAPFGDPCGRLSVPSPRDLWDCSVAN